MFYNFQAKPMMSHFLIIEKNVTLNIPIIVIIVVAHIWTLFKSGKSIYIVFLAVRKSREFRFHVSWPPIVHGISSQCGKLLLAEFDFESEGLPSEESVWSIVTNLSVIDVIQGQKIYEL